jgi:Zn finger protein HypA/HybF involved in hydrogenase expression
MKKLTTEEFIRKSKLIHKDKYDYTYSNYVSGRIKVSIMCNEHGKFMQEPRGHLLGYGCPGCGYINRHNPHTKTSDEFKNLANKNHNNRYDYSDSKFAGMHKLIKIKCHNHGIFIQAAGNHINGQGCPKCACNNISKSESKWLDTLNIYLRQKKIILNDGSNIVVDGYDPLTNTVYEFWGDYWHGNPERFNAVTVNTHNKKTFGELYHLTQIKRQKIFSNGFKLIEIWESDFIR